MTMIDTAKDVASNVANTARRFVPSMQVMGNSVAHSSTIFSYFNSMAMAAGIGANISMVYQGFSLLQLIDARLKDMANSLAAQMALAAQKEFPRYVKNMIDERVTQTSCDPLYNHLFFVYHPDNDWHPGFCRILAMESVGHEFCGFTNQIDTAFVFMLATRRSLEKREDRARKKGQSIRPTKLHLLIPAYQPILILEALKIPDEIGEFVMEGRVSNNREFVWLNLPMDQRLRYLQDIGHFAPPTQGWIDWAMSRVGLAESPLRFGEPRVLGTGQTAATRGVSSQKNGLGGLDTHDNEAGQDQQRAIPLQHRYEVGLRRGGGDDEERGGNRQGESAALHSRRPLGRRRHRRRSSSSSSSLRVQIGERRD